MSQSNTPVITSGVLITPDVVDMTKIRAWLDANPDDLRGETDTDMDAILAWAEGMDQHDGPQIFARTDFDGEFTYHGTIGPFDIGSVFAIYEFAQVEYPWGPLKSESPEVAVEVIRAKLQPWLRNDVDLRRHVGQLRGIAYDC